MLIELQLQDETTEIIARSRLRDYAHKATGLKHESLESVYEVGTQEAGYWAIVKHAGPTGPKSLAEIAGKLEAHEAYSIVYCLADSLDYLYRVEFRGGKVLGFEGFIRSAFQPATGWTASILPPTPTDIDLLVQGTYCPLTEYSAPELIDSFLPTPAADSFGIAALIFRMITGKPVVQAESAPEMARMLREKNFPTVAALVPDFSKELGQYIQKTLVASPKDRPTLQDWMAILSRYGARTLTQGSPDESVLEFHKPAHAFRFRNVLHDQIVRFHELATVTKSPGSSILISEVDDGKYTLNLPESPHGLPDYCRLCGLVGKTGTRFCSTCGVTLVTQS